MYVTISERRDREFEDEWEGHTGRLERGKEGEKYWNQIVTSKFKKKRIAFKTQALGDKTRG